MLEIQKAFEMYCKSNNPAIVEQCLKLKETVDINCCLHDDTLLTPLMFGCIHGYEDLVSVLSRHSKIDLNQRDLEGFTALHYAVAFQQRQCVFHLTKDSIWCRQPKDSPPINPNLTRYCDRPQTPIISAALALGNSEIVSMLISLPNIKLDVKDSRGRSLAQVAVESDLARDEFSCSSVLSKCPGVDWSYTSSLGETLLMLGCRQGRPKLVSLLSKIPSLHLNSQDQAGLTAAHHAVMSGSLGCLQTLVEVRGAGGSQGRRSVNWNITEI